MHALVTGAAGFIGSHVVRALLGDGHRVRALHLPSDDLRNLRGLDCELVAGDVTDPASVAGAMRGVDHVFHLAAVYSLWRRHAALMHSVNVEGTRNVLRAAADAGVRRVVQTSSIARFGGQGRRRATEDSPFALGPTGDAYSRTKRDAHRLGEQAAAAGQDVVLVAPTGPIGPGDVGPTPTGRLLLACLSMPVVAVTDTVTNFGDVRDIARGHLLAAERGRAGRSYLLGGGDLALDRLAREALAVVGMRRPVVRVPHGAARLGGRVAARWAGLSGRPPLVTPEAAAISRLGLAADCSRAVGELGLPQRPIAESLRDALVWFAREGYVRDRRLAARLRAITPAADPRPASAGARRAASPAARRPPASP